MNISHSNINILVKSQKFNFRIFDVSGRLIEQKQLNSPINKVAYNTSNLPAGSYTIEIKTNEYSYATKLIIQ